jgi:hypothetical protein
MSTTKRAVSRKKLSVAQKEPAFDSTIDQADEAVNQNLRQLCAQVTKEIAALLQSWRKATIAVGTDSRVQCPFCEQKSGGTLRLIRVASVSEKSEKSKIKEYTFQCSACQRWMIYRI